ncbi:MAPEG family protein [[Pseudomonas] carboxydohydrogena]|uniref:MAPEG family protein n=1 Tax=Afipia carboxydohydrogena TaxID=290 RepID=A0ABY8BPB2_AFICR|nr:MAPEG family protein [[Pseudomonas] carboxydohydrogena]WEF51830.1 MAPEG family protein [[Pseudomonas] carboxydohydrogena]
MPLAYWCVLVAALLPLVWAGYAKAGGDVDNHCPRDSTSDLPPKHRRAYAAHYNAYENFPFFAAAVIVAVTQGAAISTVNLLAVTYVALRVLHGLLYVFNQSTARSIVYGLALLANIAIFVLPAFR